MHSIRFFSPKENQPARPLDKVKKLPKTAQLTGYISTTGKLVFPSKTVQAISPSGPIQAMRVGSLAGTQKRNTFYLIPTEEIDPNGFPFIAAAKRSTIDLAQILHRENIRYSKVKYRFTLVPFTYEDGVSGYEAKLAVEPDKPKIPYTGKRRGRKPRVANPLS